MARPPLFRDPVVMSLRVTLARKDAERVRRAFREHGEEAARVCRAALLRRVAQLETVPRGT